MSQDIQIDVDNLASQLVGKDLHNSKRFFFTLKDQNNISNQIDNDDYLKIVDDDLESTQVEDKKGDQINNVAPKE